MNTISISPEKDTYQDLVATLADLRSAGYGLVIADGRIMLDFPTLLLENSNAEEVKKMSEISAELNIRCQELGIDFETAINFGLEPEKKKVAISGGCVSSSSLAGLMVGSASDGYFASYPRIWNHKGNPTDNSTWKPTKVRKGYGHNKLKGKNK